MDDIIDRYAEELDTLAAERCAWCGRPHKGMGRCAECEREALNSNREHADTQPLLDRHNPERVRLAAEAVLYALRKAGADMQDAIRYSMAIVERLKEPL